MRAKIQKWGNSLALRIPKVTADELRLSLGVEVEFQVRRGRLVIRVLKTNRYRLPSLLRGVRKSNLHAVVDGSPPVGRELM